MAGIEKRRAATTVVSDVTTDEIVETIYRPDTKQTAFAIARADVVEAADTWEKNGVGYRPVAPTNNLIRHGALLFPSEPVEYGDDNALVDDIVAYIGRYVALPNEAAYLSASYVLLSWLYDAYNELPYLRFRGDYGTGKTRALLVIGSLCYKAFFASGASTVSPIFHTLDSFKGTLVFDEADFRFTDEKAELVKILNNGNTKGFPVLRTQMTASKEFDPRAFTIFGPKIVGMRRSYDDRALESRFLTIEMEPGHSSGVPINLPDAQKEEALVLRNKLLMYRLHNRRMARLDSSLADERHEARMNQILLPLLSVAKNQRMSDAIRASALSVQQRIMSERSVSTNGQMLAVLKRLSVESEGKTVSLEAITTAFAAEYGSEYERPIKNRWIGSGLRRMGIALYKSNGIVVVAPNQDARIDALCGRYGIEPETTPSEELPR